MPAKIAKRYSFVNSNMHISVISNLLSNVVVEIKEIRRRNLELLVDKRGKQADLANDLEMAASILSNIITNKRGMGHVIARRIETKLKLSKGWMDKLQSKVEPPPDRLLAQLLFFYENLSPDGRDALLGKANSLYIAEHPDSSVANPYPERKTPLPRKHSTHTE